MHQAALAERYCINNPSATLTKLRLFGELLAKNIAARFGVYTDSQAQQIDTIKELKFRDILDDKLADMFHSIRFAGNAAVHEGRFPHSHPTRLVLPQRRLCRKGVTYVFIYRFRCVTNSKK